MDLIHDFAVHWYCALVAGALAMPLVPAAALYAIGGVTVVFIFIGIRDAWDVVTFMVVWTKD